MDEWDFLRLYDDHWEDLHFDKENLMAGAMNRIAYFSPSKKRENMFVGPVSAEQLDSLIGVIKQAKANGKGIVFFLWKNEPREGRKSVATLTVAEQMDRPQGDSPARRPIGNAPQSNKSGGADPLAGLMGGGSKPSAGW